MKPIYVPLAVALLALGPNVLASDGDPAAAKTTNPFYPQFCFGFGASDSQYGTPNERATLLQSLGYDGYSHYKVDGLSDVLKALDENRLRLFQFYIEVSLDPNKPTRYDARLKEALALLKGRGTVVSLLMTGGPADPAAWESQAATVVAEIADLAATHDVRVAIYPYYRTIRETVRVAQKTGRKNVGVIFSQVFFFIAEDEEDIENVLKDALPFLYAVNINGTDSGYKGYKGTDFSHLIQTLDRGGFDNLRLLKILRKLGYRGPIGLHCCYIPGDVRDNLARSMDAWKKLSLRLDAQKP